MAQRLCMASWWDDPPLFQALRSNPDPLPDAARDQVRKNFEQRISNRRFCGGLGGWNCVNDYVISYVYSYKVSPLGGSKWRDMGPL